MNNLLPVCSAVFSDKAEVSKVYDAFLPEYCTGIQKIIKTRADTYADSASLSDGLITVTIKTNIYMTYISDNQGYVKTVCFPYEFEHVFDASRVSLSDTSPMLEAKANCISAVAKPKGARSAEIKLLVSVSTGIYECFEAELFSSGKSTDVELKMCKTPITSRLMLAEKKDPVHEDIVIDASMPEIAEITDYSCKLLTNNIKINDGSLKYEGKMMFECTYRAESEHPDDSAKYIQFSKEIPFESEIANELIKPECFASGELVQTECEVSSSFDPYGESRIINVSAGYEAVFDVFEEKIVDYADDGYCYAYRCEFKKNSYSYDELCSKINTSKQIEEKVSLNSTALSDINNADMTLILSGTEYFENMLYAYGKAGVTISGIDDKGDVCCIQSTINVKIPVAELNGDTDKKYLLCAQVEDCSATLSGGEIILRANIRINGVVLCKKNITAISDADISYDFPKPICHSEYIIYYPEKNEKLWDIAKKYEISLDILKEANDIKSETVSDKKTIIVPCRI